jgi:haloalkane dehalogenase
MHISRHYLTCGKRRVHYRMGGKGPPLLIMHQSPRSSSECIPLIEAWGQHFTCIAPDIPGFGHSDPLPIERPELEDFAAALIEFCDAAGLPPLPAYGFHSGGIMLVNALKQNPGRFTALALGGYAIWNDADRAKIGDAYVPPNPPKAYGEHLVWLWNRILEQSWYFPWYDPCDETRLPGAHDDIARVDMIIQDLLNSGDHYATGYAAVLRGKRDIPSPDEMMPPVRITAYTGDPLKDHIARLGDMPAGWEAFGVDTPADHHAASLEFLLAYRSADGSIPMEIAEDREAGFAHIKTKHFDGLIHWRGPRDAKTLRIHAPAKAIEIINHATALCIDLPGHGLSDGWTGDSPNDWHDWQAVIDAVAGHFGTLETIFDPLPVGDPEQLYPDLTPDRFGQYLIRAWAIVRSEKIFAPWYSASKNTAITIDAEALSPEALVRDHRARIRGRAAKAYHHAYQSWHQI